MQYKLKHRLSAALMAGAMCCTMIPAASADEIATPETVDTLVVFVWQDGGWQKSSEGYLAMYDERTDTPVPLMKTFPQTGNIL